MPPIPHYWKRQELETHARRAREVFIQLRLAEEQDDQRFYDKVLQGAKTDALTLLAATDDLRRLSGQGLTQRPVLNVARYATRSLVSVDDLDTLTDSCFDNWLDQATERGQKPTTAAFDKAAELIAARIDVMRAPWLASGAPPTEQERTRFAEWTGSIVAASRLAAYRRNRGAKRQEEATREAIAAAGYQPRKPPSRGFDPMRHLPPGSYALTPRTLGGKSMDVPCRLRDGHPSGTVFLAIECKESNSSINSRKRLGEVSDKRARWDASGELPNQHRTVAVLAGVYDVNDLAEAQRQQVYLIWEHQLDELTRFLR